MIRLIWAMLVALVGVSTLSGAAIPFFVPGTQTGPFDMQSNETRETLFQVLNSVVLTQVGAEINPASSSAQFRWRIFDSDSSFTFGSSILDTTATYADIGMATYNTSVNVPLTGGDYYILSLQTVAVSAVMQRYEEWQQGLPLLTSDANFSVIDGQAAGGGNSILPAFSVTAGEGEAAIPEPGSLALVIAGVAVLGCWRRRRPA